METQDERISPIDAAVVNHYDLIIFADGIERGANLVDERLDARFLVVNGNDDRELYLPRLQRRGFRQAYGHGETTITG